MVCTLIFKKNSIGVEEKFKPQGTTGSEAGSNWIELYGSQSHLVNIQTVPITDTKRQRLQDEQNRPELTRQEEIDLKQKRHTHAVNRSKFALEYKNLIQESVELFAQHNVACLQSIQASAKLRALETQCREQVAELRNANAQFQRGKLSTMTAFTTFDASVRNVSVTLIVIFLLVFVSISRHDF
ncbi:hypothetical protein BC938DRAFT_478179 [Jimgerdemannia flammicorona]|uniref:Uncharacterized protein n=1 Tax=Jimgerdemannia flammicorona TaxID=994334 RepID=A0A433QN88_9FUNG|nr:hypothetical protein BC938DRAFT_478179 [Jimgerdemannia flammicorona]